LRSGAGEMTCGMLLGGWIKNPRLVIKQELNSLRA
jgi:hypothetical protein